MGVQERVNKIREFDDQNATLAGAFENYLLIHGDEDDEVSLEVREMLRDAFTAGAAGAIQTEKDWWPEMLDYAAATYGVGPDDDDDEDEEAEG